MRDRVGKEGGTKEGQRTEIMRSEGFMKRGRTECRKEEGWRE